MSKVRHLLKRFNSPKDRHVAVLISRRSGQIGALSGSTCSPIPYMSSSINAFRGSIVRRLENGVAFVEISLEPALGGFCAEDARAGGSPGCPVSGNRGMEPLQRIPFRLGAMEASSARNTTAFETPSREATHFGEIRKLWCGKDASRSCCSLDALLPGSRYATHASPGSALTLLPIVVESHATSFKIK